jgi:glycosyltransferase involved in cell wall biosynthesis
VAAGSGRLKVIRVLLVDLERGWRGGQEQAFLLLAGLRRRGHCAELMTVKHSAIASRAEAAGIRVHSVPDAGRQIGAAWRLRRLLREEPFDIVCANEAHALTAAWLARSHRRARLVAARRVVFPLSKGALGVARYRAAARILAISQAVRNELLTAGLDANRIEIVPDGVQIPAEITPDARANARKRWGFRPDDTVIECVGALMPEKGHALLIDAFAKLRREISNCRFLLAGEGRLRAQLERQAHEAGLGSEIVFAGFVADVESIYAAGDLFVFPSLSEGAGSSLIQAMAYGLPVLGFARGGVAEIIEDGRTGILVQEANAEALALAALRMLEDAELRERLSRAARETTASRYSAERMVEATIRIFEDLIAGKDRSQ